jgi:hypothetical protein
MHILDTLGRAFSFIVSLLFVAGYIAWRLKRAHDVSEADAAERKAAREGFEHLKRDPQFLRLLAYIHTKYRTTFDPSPDASTYCIRYIGLMSERYERLYPADGARARYLFAYLQRRDSPERIQAMLDLQSGACVDREMPWLGWDGLIPLMH